MVTVKARQMSRLMSRLAEVDCRVLMVAELAVSCWEKRSRRSAEWGSSQRKPADSQLSEWL